MKKNQKLVGFTLIELLVTIVIISILVTISISTFNGYFEKTRDAGRIQQFKQTVDLLKQYIIANEDMPTLTGNQSPADCAGWRVANKIYKEKVIELGTEFKYNFKENYWDWCRGFQFYIYNAGSYGCPISKGRFIVFGVTLEQLYNGDKTIDDLGLDEYQFSCRNRNWRTESKGGGREVRNIVFGIFENGDSGPQN